LLFISNTLKRFQLEQTFDSIKKIIDGVHTHTHTHIYSEITELKYTSLIKMIILEVNFKWHLEAIYIYIYIRSGVNSDVIVQLIVI